MTTPASAAPPSRLDSLTSLRFFAAAAVVIVHLQAAFDLPYIIEEVASLGYVGVTFFFVLSGFVLTWTAKPGDAARLFYSRRFARIWPAHVAVIALAVPVIYLAGKKIVWGALPFVLTLTQLWIPSKEWRNAFNPPAWSLAAEVFFYALFPFLIRVARWQQQRLRCLAVTTVAMMAISALAVVSLAPDVAWGYLLVTNPLYRLGEFILGMLLAIAMRRGWRASWPTWLAAAGCVFPYLALLMFAPHDSMGNVPRFLTNLALLPFFLAIIAAAATADIKGRRTLLRKRSLVILGDRSFALYLIHWQLILVLEAGVAGRTLNPTASLALAIGLLAASVGAAHLLYVAVERPAERRLRSFLTRRLAKPRSIDEGWLDSQGAGNVVMVSNSRSLV
ncbi:acyltransferase [Actinoplanes hulinensis]|uniref:Acyltransferase n=1 Tax=Actinoplanes hulinensis TaxID=1144547 RepID=A0ABS7BGK0_9ACTN|nr:acyltransferase [Actinoplanes hulinensis]MBW6440001.1 acyltransferase [Actinoplanes hulinensis]